MAPLALSSTERLHKKPFACLPTALRPSGAVQQWIFHQAEKKLTTLPGLRYSSDHRKGRLKILSLRGGTSDAKDNFARRDRRAVRSSQGGGLQSHGKADRGDRPSAGRQRPGLARGQFRQVALA